MRKSERDALLERAKKLRKGKQQRAGFTDFMAMSESPLVKQAKESLDGRKGAKATSGTLTFKPKTAQADTKTTKQVDTKAAQAKRKASDAMSSKKKTPSAPTSRPKTESKKFNVGVSKGGVSFKEAFKHFRSLGQSTFTWNGKKYTTDVKKAKPKAKISTPTPADFTAKQPAPKAAPTKPKGGDSKAKAKARDLTLRDKGGVRSKTRLPAGALRKFNSKTGYNSKKERLKKVGDTTYVFKKG
jgi:hypothetical protein